MDEGAVKLTVAWALPRTAVTPVGAPGIVAGVTALDTPGEELPTALLAMTANV